MIYALEMDKQREKLIEVIDYLKSTGINQKKIGFEIGVDNIYLSHLRSGGIKNITQEVLEGLHYAYGVNTRYITHGASNMFDTVGIKYASFDSFVDSWDLVEHEDKSYLHFSMDENFYKFLIEVYNLKEASKKTDDKEKMTEAFQKAFELLKEKHPTESSPKDFVLIPADDMIEIAQANISRRKSLNEVVNILNFHEEK